MTASSQPWLGHVSDSEAFRRKFAEYVIEQQLSSPVAVDAAAREHAVTGDPIGAILVRNGFLSHKDMINAILHLSADRISGERVARSRIPADTLDQFSIILTAETDTTIYAATLSDERVVEAIIREHYPEKQVTFVAFQPDRVDDFVDRMHRMNDGSRAAVADEDILDMLLYRALASGASDIHVVPRYGSYTVFFREMGVRRIIHEGPLDEYRTVMAQVKDRARMDLAERRIPQDGGFQLDYAGKLIDLRVATIPASDGEVVVLRVLDPDRVQPSLAGLGITRIEHWRTGFQRQHGLCLICGPTGSGKTTTLNASIRELDRFGKSIYTIEDPVEYRVSYTGQASVNTSVGFGFPQAVRAFMRADPDVIVLGEVRDAETARNAIKAADTGHLVLATLHTGSILGAISRLRDLEVPPQELRYLLRAVLVQSLVRILCTHCGGSGRPGADDPAHVEDGGKAGAPLVCSNCHGTGYAGRTVVSECMSFRDFKEVDAAIDGHRTWPEMIEDAFDKLKAGVTNEQELRRVFGSEVDSWLEQNG